jgi:hypothetical protein
MSILVAREEAMHNRIIISFVTAGLLSSAPYASGQQPSGDAVDKILSISDVPLVVLNAARAALRTAPIGAKIKTDDGRQVYEIVGTNVYLKKVSVVVASDGTIVKPVSPWEDDDD